MRDTFSVSKDKDRARDLLNMAKDRLNNIIPIIPKDIYYKLIEEYYEAIVQLITSLMYFDGYKTLNHVSLIEYLKNNYKEFNEIEVKIIDVLRKLRHGVVYYGKREGREYLINNLDRINSVINKLVKIINKKLGEEHKVKILKIIERTHNVRTFRVEKPKGYSFIPGQATEVSINTEELKDKKRPFTFTCLEKEPFLEFTIKMYDTHENGVTKHLRELKAGDSLIIRDVWGAIEYKGKGGFIAGGAGVTPFIAILRMLRDKEELKGNRLIFSNKTERDIILKKEFDDMKKEGLEVDYVLTKEKKKGFYFGRINRDYLKKEIKDFSQKFYICGQIAMVGELQDALKKLGADAESIVFEK